MLTDPETSTRRAATTISALPIPDTPSISRLTTEDDVHEVSSRDLLEVLPELFESTEESGKLLVDVADYTHKGEKTKKTFESEEGGTEEPLSEKEKAIEKARAELRRLQQEVKTGKWEGERTWKMKIQRRGE